MSLTMKNENSGPVTAPEDDPGFPPQEDLSHWIALLAMAANRGLAWKLAPFGVTPVQFKILHLCSASATTTIGSLTRAIPVDAAAVSRNVSTLCRLGHLHRQRSRGDRRSFRLTLTEMGHDLLLQLFRCVRDHNTNLLGGIGKEEEQSFLATVRKMLVSSGGRSLPDE